MATEVKRTKAVGQLGRFLRRQGWAFIRDGDVLRGVAGNERLRWTWSAAELCNGSFLGMSLGCAVDMPEPRRAAAAEYLTRANYGLCFGAFEMEWETGAVYFRTSLPIQPPAGVSSDALEHLVYMCHSMMSRYVGGLLAVAIGGAEPAEAVAAAEKREESSVEEPPAVSDVSNAPFTRRFAGEN